MSTLTKDNLANHLVDNLGISKREAKKLVEDFFSEVSDTLCIGENVRLSGFGNFILREKTERPGRNPRTGEVVPVKARRVVTFRAGQKLRHLMDN